MPKVPPKEKEDRLLRLWLLATRDNPNRTIESVYNDIYLEEFEGRKHEYRKIVSMAWPKKDHLSLSWLTQRVAGKWKGLELPKEPDQTVIKPWDENWGNDPARIRTLSVLSDLATDICRRDDLRNEGLQLQTEFGGFPISVCDWACKLSEFFDLQLQFECYVLLHFAYVFAADEQYATTFEEPMSFGHESFKMLMRWHKRNQESDLTQRIFESEGVVSIPIWEQSDPEDMVWAVASHLSQGPWVSRPINMGVVSMNTVNKDHAALGMAYTNPPDQEESEVVEEELLDGAYRVIGMSTTDKMIMPIEPSTANSAPNSLTQDAVLELVSDLLQDPGTLSRERAAELGMNLVATFDEILNRHEGKEE